MIFYIYTGTNIAYEQAAIKSDTLKAKLDQVKNAMNEQGIELMKELNPAITKVLGNMVNWSKYTVRLVKFMSDHRSAPSLLVAGIIAYNLWINRKIILDKLSVFWTEKLVVANKSLMASLKANPWMLAISALTVVIGLLVDYQRNQNKITQSMRSMSSINKKTADEYDKQAAKIDSLTSMINNNTLSLDERRKKIDELKSIVPGYNAQLSEEGVLINNNTEAIKEYLKQLEKQIKFKAAQDELEELFKKQRELAKNVAKAEETKSKASAGFENAASSGMSEWMEGAASEVKAATNRLENYKKQLEDVNSAIADVNKEIAQSVSSGDGSTSGTSVCPKCKNSPCTCDKVVDNEERIKQELQRLEVEHLSKITALKERYLNDSTFTQEEYNQELERLDLELLQSKMDIAGLELSQQQKLLDQLYNLKIQARDKVLAMEKKKADDERKAMEQAHKEKVSLLDRQQKEEVMKLIDKRMTENLTEEEYNRQLKELIVSFLDDKLSLEDLSEDERINLLSQKQQIELDNYIENRNRLYEENQLYLDMITDTAASIGDAMADIISGEEDAMKGLLKTMLLSAVEAVETYIRLAYVKTLTEGILTGGISLGKGLMQIAAIETSFALVKGLIGNFYTGGFTGPGEWDQPQGIVHSNEFVANRFAVANPAVRPVLNLLDHAQRNGSINNLSSSDIAAVSGNATQANQSVVMVNQSGNNSNNNDKQFIGVMNKCIHVMSLVNERFKEDIKAEVAITGKNGINKKTKDYDQLINNIRR